jgi:DNA (cytosine-5)-methyltransferase 1
VSAYYNEVDPYAAQWLRNLIAADVIAAGDVDERSIVEVRADDVRGYEQCHFFAGVGGWSVALRLAGWRDARPVWTGSCPCQPFSQAGKRKAGRDARHLWPAWLSLIAQCRPAVVFGEQVAAAVGWGWLDVVLADLEAEGYACGATVLPACSVGAPHIRDRIWFVADADWQGRGRERRPLELDEGERSPLGHDADGCGAAGDVGDAVSARHEGFELALAPDAARSSRRSAGQSGGAFWADAEWIACSDGFARPIEPGSFPLAHGLSARAPRLRAYGNAITPQVAAAFISAYGVSDAA